MAMQGPTELKPSPGQEPQAERKARIAQPPYLPLSEAIRVAEQIYEAGGGTADRDILTSLLNNSVSSSSFVRKLQALRNYRLTSGMVPPVSLTDIGLAIVSPKDEASRSASLKAAAIGPEPFRRAYERLKGKLLPQDEFLRNTFQHDLQLPRVVADAWVDSFKSALETARLLLPRPDGKIQVLEGATTFAPATADATAPEKKDLGSPAQEPGHLPDVPSQPIAGPSDGHSTKITLTDGRTATVFIPDRLTQRDATRLKGALGGIAAIIDSMVEEPS
jgi:hypothetical protein